MKRKRALWLILISDDNLRSAIKEVCDRHRWKKHHIPNKIVLWIEENLDDCIADLRARLEAGFKPSTPRITMRWDKAACKWREISEPPIYPDQCIHHALIQVLMPVMMRGMDAYAISSIEGRGNSYGQAAIERWIHTDPKGTKYCAELDIHHFYQTLPPEAVFERFKHLIKDYRVLDLIWRLIKDGIQTGSYHSQWFANTFLQPLDHAVREGGFGAKHYYRNMDNFIIFSANRRKLIKCTKFISKWLSEYGLELNDTGQVFRTAERDPQALGYRYNREYTLLKKRNLLRLKRQARRHYKRQAQGKYITAKQAQSFLSRMSLLKRCDSVNIRKKYIRNGTERYLKHIVRQHDRKERAKWNTFSEAKEIPKS